MSLEAAEQATRYRIILPTDFPTDARRTDVFMGAGENPPVAVLFSDGTAVQFLLRQEGDYRNALEQFADRGARTEVIRGVTVFVLPSGEATARGSPYRYKGLVKWVLDGVEYEVSGNHAVEQLIRMADSMLAQLV